MKSEELLNKIGIRVFEMDLYGHSIPEIVTEINEGFAPDLEGYEPDMDGNAPSFSEVMIKAILEYENIRYMMASSKIQPEARSMTLAEAIQYKRES